MFRQVDDFIREWHHESTFTVKTFQQIKNESLKKKENENIRSISILAWHITTTLSEMMRRTGLSIDGPEEHAQAPNTIEEMIQVYEASSKSIVEQISQHWKDENLLEEVNMYGEMWKKGTVLSVLIRHQAHHRGQLTILMRREGFLVPGVYGPSKEEWAMMNMPPME